MTGTYNFTASPLFAKIDKDKSSLRITPHKLEIILHKSVPGTKWSSIEGTEPIELNEISESAAKIHGAISMPAEKAPAYPTSSRTGPKNWDTVVGDDKEEDGEEIDEFFKKLYKDADPDTRRAMMKSYQESGGTALSTNWGEVGSKTMEISPPEGMEAKKWGT
jgi:suppressor of G2 allele of SKP1